MTVCIGLQNIHPPPTFTYHILFLSYLHCTFSVHTSFSASPPHPVCNIDLSLAFERKKLTSTWKYPGSRVPPSFLEKSHGLLFQMFRTWWPSNIRSHVTRSDMRTHVWHDCDACPRQGGGSRTAGGPTPPLNLPRKGGVVICELAAISRTELKNKYQCVEKTNCVLVFKDRCCIKEVQFFFYS